MTPTVIGTKRYSLRKAAAALCATVLLALGVGSTWTTTISVSFCEDFCVTGAIVRYLIGSLPSGWNVQSLTSKEKYE